MTFGAQTVTFIALTGTGVYDELGVEVKTPTPVDVKGCLHRPLSAAETPVWVTDLATQIWKTTAPADAAAVAAKATGELRVNGVTYEIVGGAKPYNDFSGNVHHVTVLSKIQVG
jgi:hypothetical protein